MNYWLQLPQADFQKLYDSRSRKLALQLRPTAIKRYEAVDNSRLAIKFDKLGVFISDSGPIQEPRLKTAH